MKRFWIISLFLLPLLPSSCIKGLDDTIDCTYGVLTYLQTSQNPLDTLKLDTWQGYYFYKDTTDYWLYSYEQAVHGVLKERKGTGTVDYDGVSEMGDSNRVMFRNLTDTVAILVFFEPSHEIYAWKRVRIPIGVKDLSTKLWLKTWRPDSIYLENGWEIVLPPKDEEEAED